MTTFILNKFCNLALQFCTALLVIQDPCSVIENLRFQVWKKLQGARSNKHADHSTLSHSKIEEYCSEYFYGCTVCVTCDTHLTGTTVAPNLQINTVWMIRRL